MNSCIRLRSMRAASANARFLLFAALYGRRIRDAPMRRHRLARPDGADFAGGVVAHGDDEIHLRRIGLSKPLP